MNDTQKAAAACLIVATLFCAMALAWGVVNCLACCCRSCLTSPLPILTGVALIMDIIGMTILIKENDNTWRQFLNGVENHSFGISLWICVASVGVMFFNMVTGILLVATSKFCLC
ncbi:unnamed protein product [Soboliphyme baturini]|uniref:MARVEL domain-containing protein n=1 Tax=Soboliphyme baturini TaxID=241478 RepID=A0A183J671_9BILA|nr:unnamed protein product [Soboliphyme baturini]